MRAAKKEKPVLRVMLADDEVLFRDLVKDLLASQKGFAVVGEAGDGPEAVRMARSLKPDVILMDIGLPMLSGIEATKAITKDLPNVKILMLSAFQDEVHVMDSVQAGAYGYLSKKLPTVELLNALMTFAEQGTMLPQPVMQKLVDRIRRTTASMETPVGKITRTQLRVLSLLGEGKSNKDIAKALGCNVKTVKNHLNTLFQKFDVKNRTEAVVKGIKIGLISGREPPP